MTDKLEERAVTVLSGEWTLQSRLIATEALLRRLTLKVRAGCKDTKEVVDEALAFLEITTDSPVPIPLNVLALAAAIQLNAERVLLRRTTQEVRRPKSVAASQEVAESLRALRARLQAARSE